MKYVFRGHIVFEYKPNEEDRKKGVVEQHQIHDVIPAYDYCRFIPDDYRMIGEFFTTAYRHIQGEDVNLEDIEVY
jgi:hypothetical protein